MRIIGILVYINFCNQQALLQENYEIKRKINVLERINGDLENEVSFLSTTKLADKTKLSEVESELSSAKGKVSLYSLEIVCNSL